VKESEDYTHFHFIAVEEEELIFGEMPGVVDSQRICPGLSCRDRLSDFKFRGPFPARREEGQRFRKDIVVY